MNPLTYLGFTIFSIIMQFCVMEFIHERFQLDKNVSSFNESIDKNNDLFKGINRKPHALFYRTETDKITFEAFNDVDTTKYSDTSLEDVTSTDISSTTYEVYYENTSIVDDFFTTESYFTSSEFDNVTEITFLDKNNTPTIKPSTRKVTNENCFCNLLYQKCDINCCCDTDCSEEEGSLFVNCHGDGGKAQETTYLCNNYPTYGSSISTDGFNNLFCIARVNLPAKRVKSHFQLDTAAINSTFKWNSIKRPDTPIQFKKSKYKYGDPVWLLKNGVISILHLPSTMTNYYCNGKKQIAFLENESIECFVKIKDLYMFSALQTLEGAKLISVTELSTNTTVLNCSTLHCTNWTFLACNENICGDYNRTIHNPACAKNYCNNLAHIIEYTFYYFDSKIINATMKMYLTKISMNMPLLMQKITVKWYIGNESIDHVIQLSGNSGYIPGLPIIISYAANNHTRNFFNQTYGTSVLPFPRNVNGQCNCLSNENKTLVFGLNRRLKCRLNIKQNVSLKNATHTCHAIQTHIKERLRLNRMLFISPYGNPREIDDENWIPLTINDRTFLYGEYRSRNSKLACYNLVTSYGFVIAYADTSQVGEREKNKIVKVTVGVTYMNVTFDLPQLSTILTIDVRFIDISKPVIEFARAPSLNIQLPADFFFDFPSNDCFDHNNAGSIILYCSIILLMMK